MSDKEIEVNSDAPLSHDDLVDGLVEMIDDNLNVSNDAPVKQQPKAEEETPEESDDDYLADVDSDDEEEVDTPEETSEADDEEESDDGDSEEVVLKVDGEEITVTMDELKKGYSRQSDYTKKTQELAEQRKAIEEEVKTLDYLRVQRDLQPDVIALHKKGQEIQKAMEAVTNGYIEEDGEMVRLSPQEIEQTQKNIDDAEREYKYEQARINKAAQDMVPPRLNELREKAPDLFSEDASVRDPMLQKIRGLREEFGFSSVEIESENDPRNILRDLELLELRDLKARVEAAKARKEKSSGVVSKPTKSSKRTGTTTRKSNDSSDKMAKAKKQLESGEMPDMEEFLGDLI